ncbi:hypothetical protein ACFYP0_15065 [Micromonospora arida]|uniref:hypothetical protein n=1 Tax=Micromonospora arida TaxID=2203715 RepID=UPI003699ED7A
MTAVVEGHPVTAHPSGDHAMRVRDLATAHQARQDQCFSPTNRRRSHHARRSLTVTTSSIRQKRRPRGDVDWTPVGRVDDLLNRHLTGLPLNGLVLDQDYERAGQVTKRLIGAGLSRKIISDMIVHRRHDLGPAGDL